MFHKLKLIEQCNFVITFIQWKDGGWLGRGGVDGLDSKLYLFILDSCQLEAVVGSNELFISCHDLGSVDAMLRFIHAVGLLKLAVLVPVHACTEQIILVFVCGTYLPTLAYLWYLVPILNMNDVTYTKHTAHCGECETWVLEDNSAKKGNKFKALIIGLGKRVRLY